ncbi:MAG: DNA polymerase III subunit chi [Pseudomonadota bacterium]
MTEILFYHLERTGLESVLPGLLEKTLSRDMRAVVRASSPERVQALDAHLWSYRDESFLPHAAAGEGARQPIWLTTDTETPNSAEILFLVDGASAAADELSGFTRCVTIFDGRDEEAVSAARGFWKSAKADGHDVTYWKQSPEGRWEKQG